MKNHGNWRSSSAETEDQKGVFRTQPSIADGAICKNSEWLS